MADPTIPIPDRDSKPYWAALAEGRLDIQQCLDCGRWTWPPQPICSKCQSENLTWRTPSGTGKVHSWVVPHRAFYPSLTGLVPFALVLVALDEEADALIPGRLVSDAEVHQGMRVRAVPRRVADEIGEILWEPVLD